MPNCYKDLYPGVPQESREEVLQTNFKELVTKDDLKTEIAHLRDLMKWIAGVAIALSIATLAFVLRLQFGH